MSAVMRRRRRKAVSLSDHTSTPEGPSSPSDHNYPSDNDSPSPSGSTLPPPSTAELKTPDDADPAPDNPNDRAWYDLDPTVVLALLSPIVNWLTGSDHVKNIFLVFLLVFYLYQIIEVPWSLYLASRPRRPLHTLPHDSSSTALKHHRAALSELHALEAFYLAFAVLSPFLGATLLRTVVISFSGQSAVSWFSLSLFVLATGMRPWNHAVQRLRQRTLDLHTVVHYPPPETQRVDALMERVAQLEAELNSIRKQSKSLNSGIYEHVEDAIEMMEIAARRQEKKAELSKALLDGRLVKLEQSVEALLEGMEIRADRPALYRVMSQISTSISALIEQLSPFLPTWVVHRWRGNVPRSPRSSPKMGRSRSSIKLETIPEVATFQPKSALQRSRYLRIPGLGIALRVCYFVTLPLRRILACLLAGQIYSSRKQASLS